MNYLIIILQAIITADLLCLIVCLYFIKPFLQDGKTVNLLVWQVERRDNIYYFEHVVPFCLQISFTDRKENSWLELLQNVLILLVIGTFFCLWQKLYFNNLNKERMMIDETSEKDLSLPNLEDLVEMSEADLRIVRLKVMSNIVQCNNDVKKSELRYKYYGKSASGDWRIHIEDKISHLKQLQNEIDARLVLFNDKRKQDHAKNYRELIGRLSEILNCETNEDIIVKKIKMLYESVQLAKKNSANADEIKKIFGLL